jgi:hypothetical protein
MIHLGSRRVRRDYATKQLIGLIELFTEDLGASWLVPGQTVYKHHKLDNYNKEFVTTTIFLVYTYIHHIERLAVHPHPIPTHNFQNYNNSYHPPKRELLDLIKHEILISGVRHEGL